MLQKPTVIIEFNTFVIYRKYLLYPSGLWSVASNRNNNSGLKKEILFPSHKKSRSLQALIQHSEVSPKSQAFSTCISEPKMLRFMVVLPIGCKMGAMTSVIISMFKKGRGWKKEEGWCPLPIPSYLEMRGFPRSPLLRLQHMSAYISQPEQSQNQPYCLWKTLLSGKVLAFPASMGGRWERQKHWE